MRLGICIALLGFGVGVAVAVPTQITYQGTLKEGGVPVTGQRSMQFRLTNAEGSAVYWSGPSMNVAVHQGLFAAALDVQGVGWRNITPYVEVSVQGQVLLPREPLASTAYAQLCGSIDDGSVLHGMIALFARSCPGGWTRFSALDGVFPLGGAAYGATGGRSTHAHTLSTAQSVGGAGGSLAVGVFPGEDRLTAFSGGGGTTIHQLTQNTLPQNHVPPYLTMVYCEKL